MEHLWSQAGLIERASTPPAKERSWHPLAIRFCTFDACFVEAAHAVVELGGERDEREGEGGAACFAEAESEVEQGFEAEFGEYVVVGWFCGLVPGDQVVA